MLVNCRLGSNTIIYTLLIAILVSFIGHTQQQEQLVLKTEPITLDLYHKFGTNSDEEFKLRATILVKPKNDYRVAQASIINQVELSDDDLKSIQKSSELGDIYSLKASLRPSKKDTEANKKSLLESQTIVKPCSLLSSNFADVITINLSPTNEFQSVNLHTTDPECLGEVPLKLPNNFNTSLVVESGSVGPSPDTATYIKRLEEERSNKAKEGKEDNRSFFAKYWVYIVPAIIILMIFSGPGEQGR